MLFIRWLPSLSNNKILQSESESSNSIVRNISSKTSFNSTPFATKPRILSWALFLCSLFQWIVISLKLNSFLSPINDTLISTCR